MVSLDLNQPAIVVQDTLNLMINNHVFDLMKRRKSLDGAIINNTRVFATSNHLQIEVLEAYRKRRPKDHKIGFVGDGSNDVRAMKAADIGISFIGCEASISAGFSIPFHEFGLVVWVLAEGKACLEICIELFKYIVFYSLAQFWGLFILYFMNKDFTNGMYYIMDLVIIVPCSIFLCFHGSEKLVRLSPIHSLFCKPILIGVIGNALVLAMAMVGAGVYVFKNQPLSFDNQDNTITVLFLLICFDMVFMSVLLVRGGPFRKSKFNNSYFVGYLIVAIVILVYFMFINWFTLIQRANDWLRDKIEFSAMVDNVLTAFEIALVLMFISHTAVEKGTQCYFKC